MAVYFPSGSPSSMRCPVLSKTNETSHRAPSASAYRRNVESIMSSRRSSLDISAWSLPSAAPTSACVLPAASGIPRRGSLRVRPGRGPRRSTLARLTSSSGISCNEAFEGFGMGSTVGVEVTFGGTSKASADDSVKFASHDVDDVEDSRGGGEADGRETLFGCGAGVNVGGMGVLQGRGGLHEGDTVLLEIRGGLLFVPLIGAEDDRRHANSMCPGTCHVKFNFKFRRAGWP